MLGIRLAEGRNFYRNHLSDAKESVIVNETLVKQFGWDSAVGKKIKFEEENIDNPTVIGVVKDFHYKRLHNKVEPLVLYMGEGIYYLSVRISPKDIHGALNLLERKWLELAPDSPFEYSFLGEDMARLYESEERNRKIFGYASWFAVFIASLGAFGFMALAAARRTKEVGIRKVLGASISSLAFLITGNFLKLVLVANLIAWPIAYFSVRHWLQNFAYRR